MTYLNKLALQILDTMTFKIDIYIYKDKTVKVVERQFETQLTPDSDTISERLKEEFGKSALFFKMVKIN